MRREKLGEEDEMRWNEWRRSKGSGGKRGMVKYRERGEVGEMRGEKVQKFRCRFLLPTLNDIHSSWGFVSRINLENLARTRTRLFYTSVSVGNRNLHWNVKSLELGKKWYDRFSMNFELKVKSGCSTMSLLNLESLARTQTQNALGVGNRDL